MNKFDKVYKSIITQSSEPAIKNLTHLGLGILKQNWKKVKFKCNCFTYKLDTATNKWVKVKSDISLKPYMKKSGGEYYHHCVISAGDFYKDEQVSIFNDQIKIYPIELTFKSSVMNHYPTFLQSINYDPTKDVTKLVFKLDDSIELGWHNYLQRGSTITMIVPGNILNPTPAKIDFNCADFDKYLKARLPKDWMWNPNNKDNWDWFVDDLHSEFENGTVTVVIDRCTIKAYGDGYSYSDDYVYEADTWGIYDLVKGYYGGGFVGKQNENLGYEIKDALFNYARKFGKNRPAKLIVRIQGQAD